MVRQFTKACLQYPGLQKRKYFRDNTFTLKRKNYCKGAGALWKITQDQQNLFVSFSIGMT